MTDLAMPLGLLWPKGDLISPAIPFEELAARMTQEVNELTDRPTTVLLQPAFGVMAPDAPDDPGDPKSSGWTVVVAANDPAADGLIDALKPLIKHRGSTVEKVLRYPGGNALDDSGWIDEVYQGIHDRPRYLLLAGNPKVLPFELQASLASAGASVGRVDFDTTDDLSAYVAKVIDHEAHKFESTAEAIVFATDAGQRDPTYYSQRYLAQPIADLIAADKRFTVTTLMGAAATKAALVGTFNRRPGLVFTASHGMAARPADGLAVQKQVNGAWCCQEAPGAKVEDWLLTGDELPATGPVWSGAVVVQFACWGYGTPTNSTFDHWLPQGVGSLAADEPFIASIPKRLLANPNGPIGYVGHVDTAWLHGFDDPAHPVPDGAYSPRLEPMCTLVDRALLDRTAAGYGLGDLTDRADSIASSVSNLVNSLRQQGQTTADLNSDERTKLADRMIRRNDAMWFLFFGDPGVRIQVSG